MSALNQGLGVCKVEGRLALTVSLAAAQLGAAPEAFRAAFSAVHSVNRRGPEDDRVAIALPEMGRGFGMAVLGRSIELFGSESALRAVLDDLRIRSIVGRGMVERGISVTPVSLAEGAEGCWLARTRRGEDCTKESMARQQRRDERRRAHIEATAGRFIPGKGPKPEAPKRDLFLKLDGGLVLHMSRGRGIWMNDPILVTTYGLSRGDSPCVLPVSPFDLRAHAEVA
ncbi:hypothetical protein LAZ40_05575 [Cereibacter sphaeroides]|uniref:hypothetical protein n=1 Tax=Cereibacter sphaeroides TaxID=1063 RepID=UPI001F28B9F7|nr:hypothetical protein [Cereibacter sphaeroides]MCE6958519.1 hypothetical protein [Cereibacter sphaeroides]MCE6972819.1 hypothetical protein [Cereibacter sphaeroides]